MRTRSDLLSYRKNLFQMMARFFFLYGWAHQHCVVPSQGRGHALWLGKSVDLFNLVLLILHGWITFYPFFYHKWGWVVIPTTTCLSFSQDFIYQYQPEVTSRFLFLGRRTSYVPLHYRSKKNNLLDFSLKLDPFACLQLILGLNGIY